MPAMLAPAGLPPPLWLLVLLDDALRELPSGGISSGACAS